MYYIELALIIIMGVNDLDARFILKLSKQRCTLFLTKKAAQTVRLFQIF